MERNKLPQVITGAFNKTHNLIKTSAFKEYTGGEPELIIILTIATYAAVPVVSQHC